MWSENERVLTGTITYYRDNFGLVNVANQFETVWFESEAVIGQIPQVNVSKIISNIFFVFFI